MAFGVYIHYPYCVQRCPYCDFATYEQSKIPSPEEYFSLLWQEIQILHPYVPYKQVDTIFLGGGTPSLMNPQNLQKTFSLLADSGFQVSPQAEITLEINPATLDPKKIEDFISSGVNRFSVGSQTFNDQLLKTIGRKHNAQETLETVRLLKQFDVSFSLDILFALPQQTLDHIKLDLETALSQNPDHISGYYLTLKKNHPLQDGRPDEDTEVEMFDYIDSTLEKNNFSRYEISNYAKPKRESQHNLLYWTDQPYWGIGLSAHSYFKNSPWGYRFWNPNSYEGYQHYIESLRSAPLTSVYSQLPSDHYEVLNNMQSLSDFCHTALRTTAGIDQHQLKLKFAEKLPGDFNQRIQQLLNQNLLQPTEKGWNLTTIGRQLSNQVFETLHFS